MAYNYRPKNAEVDPDNPRAWGACDRCGMYWNLDQLRPQMAYRGTAAPQDTRRLVCPKHLDPLNPQDITPILPPDPEPVLNPRPGLGEFAIDDLVDEDDDILSSEDDEQITDE